MEEKEQSNETPFVERSERKNFTSRIDFIQEMFLNVPSSSEDGTARARKK